MLSLLRMSLVSLVEEPYMRKYDVLICLSETVEFCLECFK